MTTIPIPSACTIALSAVLTFALGIFATPPSASAAVTYTYAGSVNSGYDETGVFGLAGQNLAGLGLTFTATFVRNDLPGADYFDDPTYTGIAGFDANSPVEGTITINGRTVSFGSYLGQQSQTDDVAGCGPGCEYEEFSHNAQSYVNSYDSATGVTTFVNNGAILSGSGFNQDFLASADYHTLSSLTSAQGVTFGGVVQVEEYLLASNGDRSAYRHGFADLTPTSLTVSGEGGPLAGVPEPASWALMVLGFGSAGAMLRARRRGLAPG